MSKYSFMYELGVNENGNIDAVLEIPRDERVNGVSGLNFEITEKDLRRMLHLFEMNREANKDVR